MKITKLKELKERRTLANSDIIEFTVKEEILTYTVKNNFLHCFNDHNDYIFRILDIDEINKFKLAEKIYKYKPINIESTFSYINWPESNIYDFPALTRLIKELYIIIEKQKPIYTKFSRFEIMEI